jgi:hypothetical protein
MQNRRKRENEERLNRGKREDDEMQNRRKRENEERPNRGKREDE